MDRTYEFNLDTSNLKWRDAFEMKYVNDIIFISNQNLMLLLSNIQ